MKPTDAIKRILALLEETDDEEDEQALWAAIVGLAGAACDEVLPQGHPYPVPYPVPTWPAYPPSPWITLTTGSTTFELPAHTWILNDAGMLESEQGGRG